MNTENIVIEGLKKVAKNKEVTLESNLKDLGLDSLDVVELLMDLEEEFDVEFENEEMVSLKTVKDVVETIDKKTVITKLPSLSIKVPSTSFGKITYQITTDNSYVLTSGTLIVYIKDKTDGTFKEHSSYNIAINGNTVGSIVIDDIMNDDIVQFKLTDVMSGDTVINNLQASCMFKY